MNASFCLPHHVAVSAFIFVEACVRVLIGCVAMGSAVFFILRSRLLLYSAGTGVNKEQVVLSGFSVRLLCFVQAKTVCMVVCISLLHSCV